MRIGVIVPDRCPNPLYRALMPMEELSRRGHTVGTAEMGKDGSLPPIEAFGDFDVVYFWRVYYQPIRRLARKLQESGIAVIWDNDDNMTAIPRAAPTYRYYGGVRGQRAWGEMRTIIRMADAVTTPSPTLAELYRSVGQEHVHVIENYVPAVRPRLRTGNRSRIVIGWVAHSEHVVDLRTLGLTNVFRELLERRPEVQLVSVGLPLGLSSPRYRHVGVIPLEQLASEVAQFDIGIAPLTDIEFNRSRSNIKVKEYAAQGVPWLASPVSPYAELGERQGGRLVEDDRWLEGLHALVVDGAERDRLAANAAAWARGETIQRNAHRWEEILGAAVQRARSAAVHG
ncbi:MAG: hypothetical protein WBD40_14315 [Tepidisphaeraceae bacterium]